MLKPGLSNINFQKMSKRLKKIFILNRFNQDKNSHETHVYKTKSKYIWEGEWAAKLERNNKNIKGDDCQEG